MLPENLRSLSEDQLRKEIEAADLRLAAEWATLGALLAEGARRGSADTPLGRWLYERRSRRSI